MTSTTSLPLRVSVEAIVQRGNQVLFVKRADHCKVAPGVWNVPAGKTEALSDHPFFELPRDAVQRECREEVGFEVQVVKELAMRIFEMKVGDANAYRVMFTYLVEPKDPKAEVKLDQKEHSEHCWIDKDKWKEAKFSSLSESLKAIFAKGW